MSGTTEFQNKTLYCNSLHHNTSQEVIYNHIMAVGQQHKINMGSLKNLKYNQAKNQAQLVWHKEEDADKFRKVLNGTVLLGNVLMVTISKSSEQRQEIYQNNCVFVKIILGKDAKEIDYPSLEDFLSSYGKVFLIRLNKTVKKSSETKEDYFGYVYFENLDGVKKILEKDEIEYINGTKLHISKYEPNVNKTEISVLQSKTIYVRDFLQEAYTQDQINNKTFIDGEILKYTEELRQAANLYSSNNSVCVKICDTKKLPFAFINFEDQDAATKFFKDKQEQQKFFVNYSVKKKKEVRVTDERKLLVKNLRESVTTEQFQAFFSQFGEIHSFYLNTGMQITVNNNTQRKVIVNSAFLNYKDKTSGEAAIRNYNAKPASTEFKELFETQMKDQYITLRMTKLERQKLKQYQKKIGSSSTNSNYINPPSQDVVQNDLQHQHAQFYAQQPYANRFGPAMRGGANMPFNPMMMRPNMPPMMGQQQMRMQQQVPQQPRPVAQKAINQGLNKLGNNMQATLEEQRKQVQITQQAEQIKQQNPNSQFSTIASIVQNKAAFDQLSKEEQRKYLGVLVFQKVSKEKSKQQAPKITGMLIDFDVFEVFEIIELLQDKRVFDERVEEAENLIAEQDQGQE